MNQSAPGGVFWIGMYHGVVALVVMVTAGSMAYVTTVDGHYELDMYIGSLLLACLAATFALSVVGLCKRSRTWRFLVVCFHLLLVAVAVPALLFVTLLSLWGLLFAPESHGMFGGLERTLGLVGLFAVFLSLPLVLVSWSCARYLGRPDVMGLFTDKEP